MTRRRMTISVRCRCRRRWAMDFLVSALDRFGSLCLLGGTPGSGKSLLATQTALDLARTGERSLFILTEQSVGAMKQRAMQMTSDMEPAEAARLLEHIAVECSVVDVTALPAYVAREVLIRAEATAVELRVPRRKSACSDRFSTCRRRCWRA